MGWPSSKSSCVHRPKTCKADGKSYCKDCNALLEHGEAVDAEEQRLRDKGKRFIDMYSYGGKK